jgi:hypothetical protein
MALVFHYPRRPYILTLTGGQRSLAGLLLHNLLAKLINQPVLCPAPQTYKSGNNKQGESRK